MAYNEKLAERIRERLSDNPNVDEKPMMGGLTFMVNDKMCVGIIKDEMMCRINPAMDEIVLEKIGCRRMDFTGKPMKGYIFISDEGMKTKKQFDYWVGLCLDFNSEAKAAKKQRKSKSGGISFL